MPQAVACQLGERLTLQPNLLKLAADVLRVQCPAVFHREDMSVAHLRFLCDLHIAGLP
jgi:hypothetical protein